jgi:hypothetical protein
MDGPSFYDIVIDGNHSDAGVGACGSIIELENIKSAKKIDYNQYKSTTNIA